MDWGAIADAFNVMFEGDIVQGSAFPRRKRSAKQLQDAWNKLRMNMA